MKKRSSLKKIFSDQLFFRKAWFGVVLIVISTMIWGTVSAQDDKTARRQRNTTSTQGVPEEQVDDENTQKPKERKRDIRRQITIQEDTMEDSAYYAYNIR